MQYRNQNYYNQPPPPNLLNEGPIPLRNINKNGGRIFDMLRGIHQEIKSMDNNHIRYDSGDSDWIPLSRKTNIIGKKIEDRLNEGIDDEDLYYVNNAGTSNYRGQTQIMDYNGPSGVYDTTFNGNKQNFVTDYKRTNIEKETTMSKVDDVDISEFIGGTTVGDSFDKTVFINMDKTNKAILANTTKICKLLGLMVQLENKNGSRLEKIIEKLDATSTSDEEDINYEDEELDAELV